MQNGVQGVALMFKLQIAVSSTLHFKTGLLSYKVYFCHSEYTFYVPQPRSIQGFDNGSHALNVLIGMQTVFAIKGQL